MKAVRGGAPAAALLRRDKDTGTVPRCMPAQADAPSPRKRRLAGVAATTTRPRRASLRTPGPGT